MVHPLRPRLGRCQIMAGVTRVQWVSSRDLVMQIFGAINVSMCCVMISGVVMDDEGWHDALCVSFFVGCGGHDDVEARLCAAFAALRAITRGDPVQGHHKQFVAIGVGKICF